MGIVIEETMFFDTIREMSKKDVQMLIDKGKDYGDSWKKRGGVGAFMMLARKWDRIENRSEKDKYDIFEAAANSMHTHGGETLLNDLSDLIGYLMLVRAHVLLKKPQRNFGVSVPIDSEGAATPRYIDQG